MTETPQIESVKAEDLRAGDQVVLRVEQVLGDGHRTYLVGVETGPLLPRQKCWRLAHPKGVEDG